MRVAPHPPIHTPVHTDFALDELHDLRQAGLIAALEKAKVVKCLDTWRRECCQRHLRHSCGSECQPRANEVQTHGYQIPSFARDHAQTMARCGGSQKAVNGWQWLAMGGLRRPPIDPNGLPPASQWPKCDRQKTLPSRSPASLSVPCAVRHLSPLQCLCVTRPTSAHSDIAWRPVCEKTTRPRRCQSSCGEAPTRRSYRSNSSKRHLAGPTGVALDGDVIRSVKRGLAHEVNQRMLVASQAFKHGARNHYRDGLAVQGDVLRPFALGTLDDL